MGVEFGLTTAVAPGRPDVTVIHIEGWLDGRSEDQLVSAVRAAKDQGAQYVVIDLAGITTITSAGIRGIQKSYGILTPTRGTIAGRLKLCNASPQVYEVLSITGLLLSVPMYESVDIAVDSFGT